jgi:hypothetical protein
MWNKPGTLIDAFRYNGNTNNHLLDLSDFGIPNSLRQFTVV